MGGPIHPSQACGGWVTQSEYHELKLISRHCVSTNIFVFNFFFNSKERLKCSQNEIVRLNGGQEPGLAPP